MNGERIFRYEVPVLDQWVPITMTTRSILHVGCRMPDVVEFWAAETPDQRITRHFRVFGTGMETAGVFVGTAIVPGGLFVWHLFEAKETTKI